VKHRIITILTLLFGATLLAACSSGAATPGTTSGGHDATAATPEENGSSAGGSGASFDFESRTVRLNDGNEMPIIGLGTWTQDDETVESSVYHALEDGYRLIDTARYYGNAAGVQAGVKRAIDDGIVTREEVFITTKIVPSRADDYREAINEVNESLDLGYIDLLLIHMQGSDEIPLYRAIEEAIDDGVVHSLGISNYYTAEDFDRVTDGARIMPAVIQNENHPFYQNTGLQQYVSQYGVVMESYYPLGGRGHTQELFNDETIAGIAEAHDRTAAQVIVHWHLQAGYIAIPGSSDPGHIAENIDVFDFELTDDEMAHLAELDTGARYENW